MSTTSSLPGATDVSALAGLNPGAARDAAKDMGDRFLKLLVAQMNNQDPLNPLDNAQVTSQMAQINTVTGINGLNTTVGKLLEQFTRLEVMQAAQLTGRDVLVEGNRLQPNADGVAHGAFSLPAAADSVTVEVVDANGLVVREMSLGAQRDGITRFTWDGRSNSGAAVAAGKYTFQVKALAGKSEIAAGTLAQARVEGVRQDGSTVQLILSGVGPVAYADVKQIL